MLNDGDILLADDDPDFVLLLQAAFEHAGIQNPLKSVRDGAEAIAYLDGAGGSGDQAAFPLPKLVLLDLQLPRVSGIEVLHWIRNQPGLTALPVVVLTGAEIEVESPLARELGATPWLVKPFTFRQLVEMIEKVRDCWLQEHAPIQAR